MCIILKKFKRELAIDHSTELHFVCRWQYYLECILARNVQITLKSSKDSGWLQLHWYYSGYNRISTRHANFIADKGADLVRITVQGKKEADACFEIKGTLFKKNDDAIVATKSWSATCRLPP